MHATTAWRQEGKDFLRALAAGVIFGTPLLFTMEMWWHGMVFAPWHLLTALAAALVLNTVLSVFLGFRKEHSVTEGISESITSVAIACLLSVVILALIGEVDSETSMDQLLGKVIMQAVMISVGIAITNAKFKPTGDAPNVGLLDTMLGDPDKLQLRQDLRDLGATIVGSLIFAFNIAPTEEVTLITARLSPWQLLILLGAEVLFCYLILFASDFWQRPVFTKDSAFQSEFAETMLATSFSLGVAFVLIMLFGHQHTVVGIHSIIASTVVLGFAAVVGGAAGRLVL